MTKIMKSLLSLIVTFLALSIGFGSINAQAQYGGTTITLPSNPNASPTVTQTSTNTTLNLNNKCSGSNVSSSVAGETLNINLCNIKSGNTIVLNNLSTSFVESIELTFSSDVSDGLFQLVKIPESLAYPNINGAFITGFEALTTRFDSSAIKSLKLNFKVDKSSVTRYSAVNAFTAASAWTGVNLTKVSEDSTFVRYSSSVSAFRQFALAGTLSTVPTSSAAAANSTSIQTSNTGLIRTGGQTQIAGGLVLVAVLFAAYAILAQRNTLKV